MANKSLQSPRQLRRVGACTHRQRGEAERAVYYDAIRPASSCGANRVCLANVKDVCEPPLPDLVQGIVSMVVTKCPNYAILTFRCDEALAPWGANFWRTFFRPRLARVAVRNRPAQR